MGYVPSQPHIKNTNNGVGAIIAKDLVLTCAHNLYFMSPTFGQRAQPEKVWIDLGNKKVKVKDFRFPDKFKQDVLNIHLYDYALLLLE